MKNTPLDYLPIDEEHVLMFAFRYALPRHTAAPRIVIGEIREKWLRIRPWTQQQMKDEVNDELDRQLVAFDHGSNCDDETWRQLLALPITPASPT